MLKPELIFRCIIILDVSIIMQVASRTGKSGHVGRCTVYSNMLFTLDRPVSHLFK